MKREVPMWLAVLVIVAVVVIVAVAYIWFSSPGRQEGGMVTKPTATVIPGGPQPAEQGK